MTQPLGFDYMEILNRSNHLKSQNTSNSAPRAANMINHWDLTTRRLNFDRWKWRSNPQNGPKLGCKAKCGQKLQRKIIWVGQSDEKWSLLQRIQCQIISLITCISLSLYCQYDLCLLSSYLRFQVEHKGWQWTVSCADCYAYCAGGHSPGLRGEPLILVYLKLERHMIKTYPNNVKQDRFFRSFSLGTIQATHDIFSVLTCSNETPMLKSSNIHVRKPQQSFWLTFIWSFLWSDASEPTFLFNGQTRDAFSCPPHDFCWPFLVAAAQELVITGKSFPRQHTSAKLQWIHRSRR